MRVIHDGVGKQGPVPVARALFAAVEPPDPRRQKSESDATTVRATV